MIGEKYIQPFKLIFHASSATTFQKFILDSSQNRNELFDVIRSCKLDEYKIRFNIWRMTMGVIGLDSEQEEKIEQLKQSRAEYQQKHQQAYNGGVSNNKKKDTKIPKNPLMNAMSKSDKNQTVLTDIMQNNDEFLKDEIRKDVERTYQQMNFFQHESIIKLLSTILFVWCKRNPEVSYKQGMNEVLASIVFVYFKEAYVNSVKPDGWEELSEDLKEVYILFHSIEHAEADIYCVFEKVMNIQQEMYKTEADSSLKGFINPNSKNNTPILQRIINITDHKLKTLDLELFRAIKLQDVKTKTFLLKWIRCMHTRQFGLHTSLVIWDSIFLDYYEWPGSKEKAQFEFIDSMCLAMFIYLRGTVLTRQTSNQILQTYQKYPQVKLGGYLEELINIAWSISDALRHPVNSDNDWYGTQSSKVNSKLQFLKGRDQKKQEVQQKYSPKKPERRDLFSPRSKPFFEDKKEKPTNLFGNNIAVEKKISSKESSEKLFPKKPEVEEKKPEQPPVQVEKKQDFSITLQANQWKQLQQLLNDSITQECDWKSNCEKALAIINKKIE